MGMMPVIHFPSAALTARGPAWGRYNCRLLMHSRLYSRESKYPTEIMTGIFSATSVFLMTREEQEEEIYLPRTITILNKKNTILKLARSRLPEKQKAI